MQTPIQHMIIQPTDSRWISFIQSNKDANIFHHPAWIEMMAECYGYNAFILAVVDENENILAGLPFHKVSSPLTGRRWVSLPFSDYCPPLYRDENALDVLAEKLVLIDKQNKLDGVEVRWELPEHPEIQRTSKFVLHTLRLEPDSDRLAGKFKRTHLQNIRQAVERGVEVEFGEQINHMKTYYRLQLETRKRHGVPCQPWRYFEMIWKRIMEPGLGFLLLAKKEDDYIGGMVYLAWGKTLIAKYAASSQDSFNLRPNNLLFWEGMRWGCRNGYEVFDMGRTEIENKGLRTFKSRWGAIEKPLYYSNISSNAQKSSESGIERTLHYVIEHSPLWVCRISGELLYRHFG
jgi:hypothetical protein